LIDTLKKRKLNYPISWITSQIHTWWRWKAQYTHLFAFFLFSKELLFYFTEKATKKEKNKRRLTMRWESIKVFKLSLSILPHKKDIKIQQKKTVMYLLYIKEIRHFKEIRKSVWYLYCPFHDELKWKWKKEKAQNLSLLTISPFLVVIPVRWNGDTDIGENTNSKAEIFVVSWQVACPVDFNCGLLWG
jgi:hypothetical protein